MAANTAEFGWILVVHRLPFWHRFVRTSVRYARPLHQLLADSIPVRRDASDGARDLLGVSKQHGV